MASGRVSKVKGKVVDIPTVPTIGTATAGGELATVTFTASTKGGPVSTYTALSNPGSVTGTGTTSPVTVTGLTAGTAYTFTVRGNNVTGSSEYSSASNSVTPTVATSYESIATVTVGSGGSSTISFTSIPSTYKHLQIRGIARNTSGSGFNKMNIRFNSDSGSVYTGHTLYGNGTSASALAAISQTYGWALRTSIPTSAITASVFGGFICDILDYASTSKQKTLRTLAGADANGSGDVELCSALWFPSTIAAITTIDITDESANFAQYSSFALYGIKGS